MAASRVMTLIYISDDSNPQLSLDNLIDFRYPQLHIQGEPLCLSYIPVSVIKYPGKRNLREKDILAYSLRLQTNIVGKA